MNAPKHVCLVTGADSMDEVEADGFGWAVCGGARLPGELTMDPGEVTCRDCLAEVADPRGNEVIAALRKAPPLEIPKGGAR